MWLSVEGALPTLRVITGKSVLAKVLVPAAGIGIVVVPVHVWPLRVLLQVGDVVGGVTTLEDGISRRALLRSFPEQLPSKRLGKLSSEHIAPRGSRGESGLVVHASGNCVDGLRG